MVRLLYYCLFLPVTLLAALCTDTRISFKFVCIGKSIDVFQNITSTIFRSNYHLYRMHENDKRQVLIAAWFMQNFSMKAINLKYHKVVLENESILLQDFQASDEATYTMSHHDYSRNKEIQLCALVPPNIHCKPRIEFKDNHLIASLNGEHCGRPAASVYWLGYNHQSMITVEPGKEAGLYHACIHSPSLGCAGALKATDYCSPFRIGDEKLQPIISLEKGNIQDNSITLQCQLHGKPKENIRWKGNGILITNNAKYFQMESNLIIRHVNNDDTYNIYTCLERGGRYESDLYSIESSGPSVVHVIPSITMVKEMDTLNVSCRTDCFPLCSVTWSRLDPFSGHNIVILTNDELQVTNVTRKMSGNYTCKVQNLITGKSIEGSISLNIHYGPDTLVLNTSNNIIEVDEFGSITILCIAECFPPCVIRWTERNIKKHIGDAELKLINVSANDTYTCDAWNPLIDTPTLSQKITITVKYDESLIPKIGVYSQNVLDYSLGLKCQSFRKPKGKFSWMVNGSLVKHNDKYSPDNDLLHVRYLTAEDENNVYTCKEPGSNLQSDPFWIQTSGPTYIRFRPKDLMVKERNGLNISCLADCYHLCLFHWFKVDPSSGHKHLYSNENVLHITDVRREMSGNYSCNVQNIITEAFKESSLSLNVLYGPDEILFNTSSNITEVDEFGSVTIVCNAKCFPPCLISWTERYRETMLRHGSDLMLVNVKTDGIYTCNATNPQVANATIVQTIIIQVKYDATMIPRIVTAKYNASDSSIVLKCLSSRSSVGRFSWSVNGSTIINSDKYSEDDMFLLIRNLSTEEQYNSYTCTELGSGFQSDHFPMKTYGPDEIFVHTSENKTEVYQFSSTTVFCSADCFPPCLFRWTFSYTDTAIEGAILTLVNVTTNGSLTCHVTNPINMNATLSESIYIMEKSEDVRHKTSSVDMDNNGHTTLIDIPSIRYVLYVIPVIGGIVTVIAVVIYLRKKYIPCTSIAQVSNNTMNAHSDIGEINQEETLIQHYWTIVTNVKGDLLTAVESDVNVELRPFVDPAGNNIPIYNRSDEHKSYSYSFNSGSIETETSCSDSTKREGYINPIHSDPTKNSEDTRRSHSMECNAYIHPVPSDPLEPDAFTESTPPYHKGGIESKDDPISSHPREHDQYTPSACVDTMQLDIDDEEIKNVETTRHLDNSPSD